MPADLTLLITAAERLHRARGRSLKEVTPSEEEIRPLIRRSIVAGRDIAAGETLTLDNLSFKRPGVGLAPENIQRLVGFRAARDIKAHELIAWTDIIS